MKPRIVLDAMGADAGPSPMVEGGLMAAGGLGVEIILVGDGVALREELKGASESENLRIVEASDVITMSDTPSEVARGRDDSSMNVGLKLVKDGEADAFVTMGNTGAAMASALVRLGRVKGISRPALGSVFPSGEDGVVMILDIGANADCRAEQLVQFAHMGSAYMERIYKQPSPRVALLSIGEEDSKGNQLTLEVNGALRESDLNFVGNVEGKDLTKEGTDVIVMDGFTGNVVLKTAEGIAEMFGKNLEKAVKLTPWNMAAGLVLKSELAKMKRRLDYTEYGGAQLLGVNGVVVIGHGRSNGRAVFNGARAARDAVQSGLLGVMETLGQEMREKKQGGGSQPEETPGES